ITTRDRVNDPFLNFLVEADWGKGRLLREFTVLLDPPTSAPASRAAAVTPLRDAPAAAAEPIEQPAPSPQSAPATTQAAAPTPRAAAAPAAAPSAPSAPAPTSAPAALQDEYSVAAGDTLWSIAQRNLPDASVSVNQMM